MSNGDRVQTAPIFSGGGAWIVAAALAVALYPGSLELFAVVKGMIQHTPLGGDLATQYAHADMIFNRHVSPYNWEEARRYPIWMPSFYPVFAYPLFWLLTLFPLGWALVLDTLLQFCVLATLAWLLLRHVAPSIEGGRWTPLLAVVLAAAPAVHANFNEHQVNLCVSLILLLAMLLVRDRRHDWTVGVMLGLAPLLKFYFILLLAVPLLRGDWRVLASAIGVVVGAIVLTFVFVPWPIWLEWFEFATRSGYTVRPYGADIIYWFHNQSLNGYVVRLFGGGNLAKAIAYCSAIAVALTTLGVLIADRRLPRALFYPKALICVVLSAFILAPLSWVHYLIYQFVAAIWLWADLSAARRLSARRRFWIVALLLALLLPWRALLLPPFEQYFGWFLLPMTIALWLCCILHRPHGFGILQPAERAAAS